MKPKGCFENFLKLITALGGGVGIVALLVFVLNQSKLPPQSDDCQQRVAQAWKIIDAHRGNVTEAMDDVTEFFMVVTEHGCIGSTYNLNINKQRIRSIVVTPLEEYSSSLADKGLRYHYRKMEMTIDVAGERQTRTHLLRKPIGIDGDWEML